MQKIKKRLLFLLIATSPLSIFYYQFPGIPFSVTPFRISLILAGVFFITEIFTDFTVKVPKNIFWIIISLILVYTISFVRADAKFRDHANFAYLEAFVFFVTILILVHFINNKKSLDIAIKYLLITTIIVIFIGYTETIIKLNFGINIWKYITHYEASSKHPFQYLASYKIKDVIIPRICGTFFDPNLFAYYLIFPLGITFSNMVLKGRKIITRNKKLNNILFFLIAATILITLSRSGIVFAFILITIMILRGKTNIPKLLHLIFVILSIIFLVSVFLNIFFSESLLSVTYSRFSVIDLGGRSLRWSAGLEAFSSNILFGVGQGNLGYYLPSTLKQNENITTHSFYLNILAQIGLIGSFVLSLFFIFIFYRLKKDYKRNQNPINTVFFAVVLSLLGSQLLYSNLYNPALAVQLGIVISYIKISGILNINYTEKKSRYK
ncbi:MAG: O-antigen ligase family protein [Promethearchaeota archaeon]